MFRKTMIYLGLGPDEHYEHDDDFAHAGAGHYAESERTPDNRPHVQSTASAPGTGTVRPIPRNRPEQPEQMGQMGTVRAVPTPERHRSEASRVDRSDNHPSTFTNQAVRIVESPNTKPHAISPTSFNDAQPIADRFKSGQPVIINLQGVSRDMRRRIVDFASGLCYALAGKMDRVADQVYLLTPADVVVSPAETRDAIR